MTTNTSVEAQKKYVEELKRRKFKFGLTVGEAFVRGIRDIGYKSTATALDELIDNAMQSGAANVQVAFGFDGAKTDKKPTEIAVIDDGHGMLPDMIRAAMTWGGTHRENDRTGLGRYGYGLPSSCVSTGRKYTVYSRQSGADFFAVTVDVDEISEGKYSTPDSDIIVPEAVKAALPRFADAHIKKYFPGGISKVRTVIIIEKLDKLTWRTSGALQENLLRHFGVVYHKLRADLNISVNDKRVEPIDPLFITPGFRWFDLDEDRALPLDPIIIDVKNPETRSVEGHITIRISYLPPGFASIDKMRKADGKNGNERLSVMKDYNGFIVARMGRIIDVVTRATTSNDVIQFRTNDRYIKIEIDFPAALDEEFNVTTSKQQIVPSERIWDLLRQSGLMKAVEQLRNKYTEGAATLRDKRDAAKAEKRLSEEAMERAAMLAPRPTPEAEARKQEMGSKGLNQEAERRARSSGRPVEDTRKELEFELKGRLYKVATESVPGGSMFRMDMFGGTKVLFLNTSHRFYKEVHSGPNATAEVRASLEILLFAVGDRILETSDHLRDIYMHEVPEWSKKLDYALGQLAQGIGHPEDDDAETDSKALVAAE
jgi:hypothetical protein